MWVTARGAVLWIRLRGMVGSRDAVGEGVDVELGEVTGGGRGRCNRWAASRSPGASNAIAGRPNVAPRREASDPPRE